MQMLPDPLITFKREGVTVYVMVDSGHVIGRDWDHGQEMVKKLEEAVDSLAERVMNQADL